MRRRPERAAEGGRHRACWDVGGFPQGPVVHSEGAGECAPAERQREVHQPQQHRRVTHLQHHQVAMIHTLTAVKRKHTLRTRTHTAHIALTESLQCGAYTHTRADTHRQLQLIQCTFYKVGGIACEAVNLSEVCACVCVPEGHRSYCCIYSLFVSTSLYTQHHQMKPRT